MGAASVTLLLVAYVAAMNLLDGCAGIASPGQAVHPDTQTGHLVGTGAHDDILGPVGPGTKVKRVVGPKVRVIDDTTSIKTSLVPLFPVKCMTSRRHLVVPVRTGIATQCKK